MAAASTAAYPKLKLLYFNGRGRAERARLLLADIGAAYEDSRFEEKDWSALKLKQPFNQVPTLTINDKTVLAQSSAIERYIARLGKLMGRDVMDEARIDMIGEGLLDCRRSFYEGFFTKDEAEKKTKVDAYFNTSFPQMIGQLNALLESNNGGNGWFVGSDFSYADLNAYATIEEIGMRFNKTGAQILEQYAKAQSGKLLGLIANVGKRPRIAAWVKARPVTPF